MYCDVVGLGRAVMSHGCTTGYSREAPIDSDPRPRREEAYPGPVVGHPLHVRLRGRHRRGSAPMSINPQVGLHIATWVKLINGTVSICALKRRLWWYAARKVAIRRSFKKIVRKSDEIF